MADYDPCEAARQIVASVLPSLAQASFALELVVCPECGVHYALSTAFVVIRARQQGDDDDDGAIWCPNGHKWWWRRSFSEMVESQVSKALEALAEQPGASPRALGVKKLQRELVQVRHDREQLEAELSAVKAGGKCRGSGKGPKCQNPPEPKRDGGPGSGLSGESHNR